MPMVIFVGRRTNCRSKCRLFQQPWMRSCEDYMLFYKAVDFLLYKRGNPSHALGYHHNYFSSHNLFVNNECGLYFDTCYKICPVIYFSHVDQYRNFRYDDGIDRYLFVMTHATGLYHKAEEENMLVISSHAWFVNVLFIYEPIFLL